MRYFFYYYENGFYEFLLEGLTKGHGRKFTEAQIKSKLMEAPYEYTSSEADDLTTQAQTQDVLLYLKEER